MTGREMLAAVRPLEAFAGTVARFADVAHEAIRLEEGQAAAQRRLTELTGSVTAAQAELQRLQAEAAALTTTLAAERAAATAALAAEAAARGRAVDAEIAQKQLLLKNWASQEREAAERFARQRTDLQAAEQTLKATVDRLRDDARRMAREAEAILR